MITPAGVVEYGSIDDMSKLFNFFMIFSIIMIIIICVIGLFLMDIKTIDTWSVETRAVCNDSVCQDYVITCHGDIPVQIRPIGNQVSNLKNMTSENFCQNSV